MTQSNSKPCFHFNIIMEFPRSVLVFPRKLSSFIFCNLLYFSHVSLYDEQLLSFEIFITVLTDVRVGILVVFVSKYN